ncbi:uncharacterized protein LOC130772333 isoform X2 [Actinidia eriantha]|uniref:uncharacterized protein LOC130772333 isoform X2 n=1 Tax=Actinidia eriantha TaxID=165200 RepID=UPI00258E42AE|nr:uncharacterized protein LOC130772333 isoform X2 [Actinidia eriantha]
MSAVVCGKRSSFFEDLPQSPKVSKRVRFSSSPVWFSPPRPTIGSSSSPLVLDHLSDLFPDMDKQALEECGNNLDLAIRSLNELQLGPAENLGLAATECDFTQAENMQFQASGVVNTNAEVSSPEDPSAPENLPPNGADWVELFVREMTNASNMDDAKARASRALEVLEKSICARTTSEAAQTLQQENVMLKEQVELLVHENSVLKRAVSIQHVRQKEFEDRTREFHHLKQLASQCQEQLRTLEVKMPNVKISEVNNYALTMHLNQAQQSNSIPGSFHPDVF